MTDRQKLLERCMKLKKEADYAEERLKELTARVTSRTDFYSRGSEKGQPTEREAVERICLEEHLKEILANYKAVLDEITAAARKMDDPVFRSIIVMRYVEGKDYFDIADDLGYSYSHIYKLRRDAVIAFCRE